jgi:hypothetical protein
VVFGVAAAVPLALSADTMWNRTSNENATWGDVNHRAPNPMFTLVADRPSTDAAGFADAPVPNAEVDDRTCARPTPALT